MRAIPLPHSIRGRLVALTLALLLPALILTAVLLWRAYIQEHDAAERQLTDTARAMSLVVDRQIGQTSTLLDALSTSNRLKRGEFRNFAGQAREANTDPTRWVMVMDRTGQQLVNSAVPDGVALPRGPASGHGVTYRTFDQGTRLWNMTISPNTHRPVVVVAKTVRLNDGRLIELATGTPAREFGRLFAEQRVPKRWTSVILDGDYRIVARNRGGDRFVGHQVSAASRKRLEASETSVALATTLDGIPVVRAAARSPLTGWTLTIAVPRTELAAGAWSSLVAGAALGILLLSFGLFISYRLGRSVALPIGRLAAGAAALGRGEDSDTARSPLIEIGAVQDALRDAGTALHNREQDLQALNNSLELRVIERTRELAEAAESLVQAQKMEAIGRLTGGIAHDFNNLLTAVIGNIEMLQRTSADERTSRLLGSARQAADRGAKLTSQLLAFSRRQQLRAEVVDIERAIEGTVELLGSTLSGAISIVRVPSPDLWLASADPTQLDLILLNLAINARDAMPTGGSILIESANVTIDEAPKTSEQPGAGDYVAITLSDRGSGMPPEVLARVFDPFFTTKPVGQGTGLGLPQVLGVLKQLGGGVRIESRVGEGTSVTIFLPRSQAERPAPIEDAVDAIGDLRGMRLLLIDDDPDVRGVAATMLREAGCTVVDAESGRQGVAKLSGDAVFDIALIDFAMPGMNGAETAVAIRIERPALPILLMSGYADVEALSSVWAGPLLPKPFTAASLQAGICEAARRHRVTPFRVRRS